jgi:hypothetical protein
MSTDPTPDGVTPETFDLLDWIESGTVARRQVEIHNDPALVEEYQALEAELAEAEKAVGSSGQDGPLAADGPREAIVARMEALWERWEASKALWTVRALSKDDIDATFDAVPVPKRPIPPLEKAGQKAQERFVEALNDYQHEAAKADEERKLHILAAAVVSVETSRGTAEGVTVDALKRLRSRPHGAHWIDRLYRAAEAATQGDQDIPRPTSPVRSTTTQG